MEITQGIEIVGWYFVGRVNLNIIICHFIRYVPDNMGIYQYVMHCVSFKSLDKICEGGIQFLF